MQKKMMFVLLIGTIAVFGMISCEFLTSDSPNGENVVLEGSGAVTITFDNVVYNLEEGFTGTRNPIELTGTAVAGADDGTGKIHAAAFALDIDDFDDILGFEENADLYDVTAVFITFYYVHEEPGTYDGKIFFQHVDVNDTYIQFFSEEVEVVISEFGEVGENIAGEFTADVSGVRINLPDGSGVPFEDEEVIVSFEVERLAGTAEFDIELYIVDPDE